MTIKARNFKQTVIGIMFIKNWSAKAAKEFLLNSNIMENDDVFLLMDADGKLYVKLHLVGTPMEMEIEF